ncbi:hypothetical protein GLYMA_07G107025v4 [Glycine max]|uniref:pentatricopeptide repeat-containing protein At1g62930, chloroplastic-like n=1 Tax=Glycine soja TaxID=3848 RepID=UPI0003DED89B|nr:pentatricopeptide repeat-containing protein At1g62930, chloroplastic-like [Glycine soja]KAG4400675.1 hypothetical protein GLYMA_07G107025v4 [Glycine max]KAH1086283.1 hypothetical protein GYH30_017999 [Glycine max]
MCESGVAPDVVTYSFLLDGLCQGQHLDLAVVLFNQLIKRGMALDVWSYSILIDGCCKNQRIDLGESLMRGSLLMRCMTMLHPWMLSITLMHFTETSILVASALLQHIVDGGVC